MFSSYAKALCSLLFAVTLSLPATTSAAVITTQAMQTDISRYTYNFQITAEVGEDTITQFSIFFNPDLYASLKVLSAPAAWDVIAIQPDVGLSSDGYVDMLALGSGVSEGESVSGFSVSVLYSGVLPTGALRFDIVDPLTFGTLSSGLTDIKQITTVPEPTSGALLGLALAALAVSRRKARSAAELR